MIVWVVSGHGWDAGCGSATLDGKIMYFYCEDGKKLGTNIGTGLGVELWKMLRHRFVGTHDKNLEAVLNHKEARPEKGSCKNYKVRGLSKTEASSSNAFWCGIVALGDYADTIPKTVSSPSSPGTSATHIVYVDGPLLFSQVIKTFDSDSDTMTIEEILKMNGCPAQIIWLCCR